MDVIYPNLSLGFRKYPWRKREERRRAYEFTPGKHAKV
jgi:hypothetical protein